MPLGVHHRADAEERPSPAHDRNFGKTPDYLPNISPYIRRELNKTSQPGRTTTDYAVPYMWGTAGILYNRNFITPDEAGSWHCLWNPRNKGKILMKDSYRDAYGTAIIYAHARQLADSTVTVEQLMNDNSPEAIALAEKYLKAMKPNIAGWEADFGKEMMTKNKPGSTSPGAATPYGPSKKPVPWAWTLPTKCRAKAATSGTTAG